MKLLQQIMKTDAVEVLHHCSESGLFDSRSHVQSSRVYCINAPSSTTSMNVRIHMSAQKWEMKRDTT